MPRFISLQLLYDAILLICCAYAVWRGGRPERIGAALMMIGSVATVIVQTHFHFTWKSSSRHALVAVDGAVLVAFLILALRSNRFWPIWASAFHLIAVATHLAIEIEPRRVLQAYAMAQGFWAYPMLAVIVIGARRHHARLRQARIRARSM